MTQAIDTVSDVGSELNKQRATISRPSQNMDPFCSTIRRKTSRARQCYFNGMLDNEGATGPCDTVRRRRQKSVAYWQQGNNGGGVLAADETDSGIALTPEWEFVPPAWPRNEERPASGDVRRKYATAETIQTASLKVPGASQWGSAFDTMIAELRCRLPGASGPDKLAVADHELPEQPCDGRLATDAADSCPTAVLTTAANQDDEQQSCSGDNQDSSGSISNSDSSNCSAECSADDYASNNGYNGVAIGVNANATAGSQVPCTFRDIIYRRTGKSLTIDIVPPIVKTASNNEVWIKLRNDQDDGQRGKTAGKTRHALPQPATPRQVGEKSKSGGASAVGAGEGQPGRWQKLRRLFSVRVNKKERSQGRTRITLKSNGSQHDQ